MPHDNSRTHQSGHSGSHSNPRALYNYHNVVALISRFVLHRCLPDRPSSSSKYRKSLFSQIKNSSRLSRIAFSKIKMLNFHIPIHENSFWIYENKILVLGYEFASEFCNEAVENPFGEAQLGFRGILVQSKDTERVDQLARMIYASGPDPQITRELEAVFQELWPRSVPWVTSTSRLTASPPFLPRETQLDLISRSMAKNKSGFGS